MTNLIDIDLQEYEPAKEPGESAPELEEVRSADGSSRPRSQAKLPHPPGPAGLMVPRTRLWIKRPPGPAGL